MIRDPAWLLQHKRNVYSQTGEDGIIEAILAATGEGDSWCVEFGAWDGQHLSNTRYLIESHSYKAVLIEGDKERWAALKGFYQGNHKVIPINTLVGFGEADGLDAILRKTDIPSGFDFLSIDIDGNDFHVWKAMCAYWPKLICIEFNPTIPTECDFVQPANPRLNQGASLISLVKLGKVKGYELASVLPFNAFFVRNDLFGRLEIGDNSAEALRKDLSLLTYLFHGYDGHIFLHGNRRLVWHDIDLLEERAQVLPAALQKFPENYSSAEKLSFEVYRRWLVFLRRIRKLREFATKRQDRAAK
ncbi:MAG: hypothetical protein L0Y50_07730 [Beijerinckiaceae bacterium]|nr:hypothetical protein [Beijerinckiaceae bacterium]MCI0736146.1 hypothetical protein [Beijerinckiaceae bacterium]